MVIEEDEEEEQADLGLDDAAALATAAVKGKGQEPLARGRGGQRVRGSGVKRKRSKTSGESGGRGVADVESEEEGGGHKARVKGPDGVGGQEELAALKGVKGGKPTVRYVCCQRMRVLAIEREYRTYTARKNIDRLRNRRSIDPTTDPETVSDNIETKTGDFCC